MTAAPTSLPLPSPAPPAPAADDGYTGIRRLIYVYFWLLIFEGALRKWVLPGLATPLLLVRDPVLLLCYLVAFQKGKFPKSGFVTASIILGAISAGISFFVTSIGDSYKLLLITLFGLHANFFHLPLIFLMRDAFNRERIRIFGTWLLILSPLVAYLIFLQFLAPPGAWINRGAGVNAGQITSGVAGVEKVRPAGPFSYNTGVASFLSLLAAFLLQQVLGAKAYPRALVLTALASLTVAGCLSISRSTAFAIVTVYATALLCVLLIPRLFSRSLVVGGMVGAILLIIAQFSILGQGLSILNARVEQSQGLKVGGSDRFLDAFAAPFRVIETAGLFGAGLGLGTNAGGQVMTGDRAFYLGTETEWARHVLEGGVVLGFAYILLRISLCVYLTIVAFLAIKREQPLSLLLLSTCFLLVLIGPFGIPMTLGFAVFSAGLCLAAANDPPNSANEEEPALPLPEEAPVLIRGRSAYAERLHGGGPAA